MFIGTTFGVAVLSRIGGVTRVPGMESDSARSTILVVDDDPAILEYAGGVLEECGYAVLTAPNATCASPSRETSGTGITW